MVARDDKSETALVGMAAICQYMNRGEKTVLNLIRDEDFPARKLGGIWESDKELVDKWRRRRISMDREQEFRARSM